ncbi:response regulator [Pelagicoccus sp. SDUM812002]|uniref:response regulator n=1 Tax=Pelagicoccus sp. SDUM812002 TaxID=3041266 RepID=UPI00280C54BF|nr:response regulator [Pelagicoccus sp. SDUM812002]MDQ8186247.1 ATP-binding protein [Pelagicoccus sp. SDUM812002]
MKSANATHPNFRHTRCLTLLIASIVFVLGGVGGLARAQNESTSEDSGSLTPTKITTFGEYWIAAQIEELKDLPHSLELEFDVLHYDPEWGNLWAAQDGVGGYVPISSTPMPFKSGNRVSLKGLIIPSKGLQPELITPSVLAAEAFPDPRSFTAFDDSDALSEKELQWASVEGYIDQLVHQDPTHLAYEMITGGRRIEVRLLVDKREPIPNVTGSFVKIQGLIVVTNAGEETEDGITIWVDGIDNIQHSTASAESASKLPQSDLETLPEHQPDQLLRVHGVVYRHSPASTLILRDQTGQVQVPIQQRSPLKTGDLVDVIGYPRPAGASWSLADALYLPAKTGDTSEETSALLLQYRLSEQVLSVPIDQLELGHSAKLSGVITYVDPQHQYFYMQDSTGGVRIEPTEPITAVPQIGDSVSVEGAIAPGPFSPMVLARDLKFSGQLPLPAPEYTSYNEALSGSYDSQWVEMVGYVDQARSDGHWTELVLSTPQGDFEAKIYSANETNIPKFQVGTTMRLRGVLVTEADSNRHFRSILFVVPEERFTSIEVKTLENPFELPLSDFGTLERYKPRNFSNQYQHVRGVVTHHQAGRTLYLSDGENILRVLSHSNIQLEPNDVVDVVGLPQRSATGLYLRNSQIKKTGETADIEPIPLGNEITALDQKLDGRLISLNGSLTDLAISEKQIRLFLNCDQNMIEAIGDREDFDPLLSQLAQGAQLQLTGVYYLVYNEHSLPQESSLLLRKADDIVILKSAPWWTPERTVGALLLSLLAIAIGGSWAFFLRRRVAAQTLTIREKIEREALLESQNREIVSSVADFIFTIDFDGKFLTFNEAGERLTGYAKSQIRYHTIYDLLDERKSRILRKLLSRKRNIENSVFETQIRKKDGSLVWVEVSAGFIRRKGEAAYLFGVMHDIDSRKQVECELTRAKEAAEENTRAKSAFLATMSHELRTPMNGIIGMTELLLDLKVSKQAREFGETIRDSAASLLVLLNDILDLSKAEAGKLTVDPHPFNLAEAVKQTVNLLETTALSKEIDFHLTLPETLPEQVLGDAGRLRQVLLNLVGNAIKFTEQGEVRVSISLDSQTDTTVNYRFQIVDTGIGIPEKAKAKLFQSFVQADNSHSRRFGGSGLGLKISQEIVSLLGGQIGMTSQEGVGSKFWFTAHFEKVAPSQDEVVETDVSAPAKKTKKPTWKGPPVNVLVAEDIPINQRVTLLQLKRMGIEADLAKDGHEVLKAAQKKRYDVIFMDCQMPGMDGLEATRQLRADPAHDSIHIVALTANAMDGDRERCIDAGMNDYVSKPTRPDKLYAAIETATATKT